LQNQNRASMRKNLLPVLILLAIPYLGIAQVFSNLDFEYGVYKAQPRKWAIEGEGENYSARLDSLNSKNGNKSLYVTVKNARVFIFLSIPGQLIAGKDIQVEGYFKSSSSDSLQAMLMFRNPNGGRPIPSQPNNSKSKEWQIISHQASFPNNYSSDRLLIALMANGTGRFWFDNVKIKIDGQEYGNGHPDFREPTKKEIETLDKRILPIKSLEPNSTNKDLIPLKNIIGISTIVALGENSHGSSSIYKLKLRMVKYMVENEGFSIFALESPTVEADKINEYVSFGKGTIEEVIKDLVYPSWQTQEMIDIIQWMKSYNQGAKEKIEFRGFDMQNGLSALRAVEDFAKINDSTLTASLLELDKLYSEPTKDDQKWKLIVQKSDEINLYLTSKKYSGADLKYFEKIKHYMNIFSQSLSSDYKSEKAKTRDEYMAQNINWLVKNSGDDVKMILSADNTHITKASGKMGYFLKDWYGDKYLTFGFTYSKGSYAAYGPEKHYEVHPSFVGTYEYYFSKSKFKNYFLDIKSITDIDILNHPAGFRSIGSRPQETTQFTEINLKNHFDVIVYLENSLHTDNLIK
jgi:erythromycin esterase